MIKAITLENWKSHYRTSLEFSKGTNVIVGKSGSGKSSIMDAISFALYGTFPSLASRRVSLEETIMAKPAKQSQSTIKMEFEYGGKNYFIERTLRRAGMSEAYLREGEKLIAGPKTTDVTKKVTELLEVSYDLFSRAIYSEQNQIDFFLKLSPSQRKEKFDELLGLDRYEKVRTNCVTLQNRIRKMDEDRKAFLDEQKKKTGTQQLEEYEARIREKEAEGTKLAAEIKGLEKEIADREKRLSEGETLEKELRQLKEGGIRLASRAEALSEDVARAEKKLDGIEMTKVKEALLGSEALYASLGDQKKELDMQADLKDKEIVKAKEQRAVFSNLLSTNEKIRGNYKRIGGECPTCKRPLSEHEREKLEKELTESDNKIRASIGETEGILQKIHSEYEQICKRAEEKGKLAQEAQKKAVELKTLTGLAGEAVEKQKQCKLVQKQLEETRGKIAAIKFDPAGFEKERSEFYALRERAAKARAEARAAGELLKELQAGVKRIKDAQEQIAQLDGKIKHNEKTLEKLAVFTSALRATQGQLRAEMIATVNAAMDEVWQKVYPYADISTVKIAAQENSYEIMALQSNSEWVRVEGILSGGERSAVALTLRIAISLVLTQNLGWIILDEPTHNLDANSVVGLSETMASHMPQFIGQIFIITHDKQMENAASGKLYTLEREKEKDGVTKVVGE